MDDESITSLLRADERITPLLRALVAKFDAGARNALLRTWKPWWMRWKWRAMKAHRRSRRRVFGNHRPRSISRDPASPGGEAA